MKTAVYYGLTVWAILWIQVACNHLLGGTPFAFQGVLVAVIYFGLWQGPLVGELLGFTLGLLIDASSLGVLGIHSLLYALAGYSSGMLRRQLDASKIWTQTIFSWATSILYLMLYIGIERLLSITSRPLSWYWFLQPFINAALAPLIFLALMHWAKVWGIHEEER